MTRDFLAGARRAVPIILSAMPFALLFGALAVENGLSVWQVVAFSATVYAGASQMVGIELFGQQAAPWLIAFSIFVVNARHILYSATIGRHMGHLTRLQKAVAFFFLIDPQFAETEREVERTGRFGFAWYMGMAAAIYVTWLAETALGATFGRLIPDPHRWGLDVLLTVYFLGLVMGFRARPGWLPVVIVSGAASVLAHLTVGSPWHVSLGALAGVAWAAAFGVRGARDA
jgi:predicted branched-subunit amino acid permease